MQQSNLSGKSVIYYVFVEPAIVRRGSKAVHSCKLIIFGINDEQLQDAEHKLFALSSMSRTTFSPCKCVHTLKGCNICVGGIVASIAASQAVDPGSIPGQCNKATYREIVSFTKSLRNQQWSEEAQNNPWEKWWAVVRRRTQAFCTFLYVPYNLFLQQICTL